MRRNSTGLESRWSIVAACLVVFTASAGAYATNLCPYDTTGTYVYDPGTTPNHFFYGDDAITGSQENVWYLDDLYACLEAHYEPAYLLYLPKCDFDGDNVVSLDELYDIYYRLHPVQQPDLVAQTACVEAFDGGPFFFCVESAYHRTDADMDAIMTQYPATAAIIEPGAVGAGHESNGYSYEEITCTKTGGEFPVGVFDLLNECYLAQTTCGTDCSEVSVEFDAAINTTAVVAEYHDEAVLYGGSCSRIWTATWPGDAPGFHFFEYNSAGWWYWTVRSTAQCSGWQCDCDVTYGLWTHRDHPGTVWLDAQTNSTTAGCTDSRFPGASCPDDDGDGVCNTDDLCPGYDDSDDLDGDGIPDGCDVSSRPCPGDANLDGETNELDATLITAMLGADPQSLSGAARANFHIADLNHDGVVTAADQVVQQNDLGCYDTLFIDDYYQYMTDFLSELVNVTASLPENPGIPVTAAVIGIVRNGEVVGVRGWQNPNPTGALDGFIGTVPVGPNTLFKIGSSTKSMTAGTVFVMTEQVGLDVDSPVNNYDEIDIAPRDAYLRYHSCLYDWSYCGGNCGPSASAITLRHLLRHRSSLEKRTGGWLTMDYYVEDAHLTIADWLAERSIYWDRTSSGTVPAVNSSWEYSNIGYTIVGRVIEHAYGTYATAVEEYLFAPVGLFTATFDGAAAEASGDYVPQGITQNYAVAGNETWNEHSVHGSVPFDPAGGAYASGLDMVRYLQILSAGFGEAGVSFDGNQVIGAAPLNSWRGQAEGANPDWDSSWATDVSTGIPKYYNRYAMPGLYGASANDGHSIPVRVIWHGGHASGMVNFFMFTPEDGFAVIVMTNSQFSSADCITEYVLQREYNVIGSAGDGALDAWNCTGLMGAPNRNPQGYCD